MGNEQRPDDIVGLSAERAARVDEIGRQAGAAMRQPAPPDGLADIRHVARRKRAVRATAAAATLVGAVIAGFVVFSHGDTDDGLSPTLTTPDVATPTTVPPAESPVARIVYSTGRVVPNSQGNQGGQEPWVVPDDSGLNSSDADGSNSKILADGHASSPAWSPSGTEVAFVAGSAYCCGHSLDTRVVVIGADGTGREIIYAGQPIPGGVAWSPDGTMIAFVSRQQKQGLGGWNTVDVINADGTDHRSLDYKGYPSWPAWSPDGNQLAFFEWEDQSIKVMNIVSGTEIRTLVPGMQPAWSPDGTKIAFARRDGGISIVDANGGGQIDLTTGGFRPSWSPDGSQIVYARPEGGISVMNTDGTDDTSLLDGPSDFSVLWRQP